MDIFLCQTHVAGDAIFGIFIYSSDHAHLLLHIRARYSLRLIATASDCCSRSNCNCHNLADTSSNLSTWCRVMVTWISLGLPPATLTLFSCFGRGIVQVQVFKMVYTTQFAWRPQGYRGRRDGTCYIAMFCTLSALLIWNICKQQWQSVALGLALFCRIGTLRCVLDCVSGT